MQIQTSGAAVRMQNTEASKGGEVMWRRSREACCPEGSRWLVASTYPSSWWWCCLGGDRVEWQSDRGNYLGEATPGWRGTETTLLGSRWPPMSLTATYWTLQHPATERSLHRHCATQQQVQRPTEVYIPCTSDFIHMYPALEPNQFTPLYIVYIVFWPCLFTVSQKKKKHLLSTGLLALHLLGKKRKICSLTMLWPIQDMLMAGWFSIQGAALWLMQFK